MKRQGTPQELLEWLRGEAERLSSLYFDEEMQKMPRVRIELGMQEDLTGVMAHYIPSKRRIEFSPGFLESCWMEKKGVWDFSRARDILQHELSHGWVDWKGKWTGFAGFHNEWFLWKAHHVGVNLGTTRDKWQEVIPLHDEIKRGWNPFHISFGEWRRLVEATEDWKSKSWHCLLDDCQAIEEIENSIAPENWPRIVKEMGRWNRFIHGYGVIKSIKTHRSFYDLLEIIETIERRGQPVYEFIEELQRRSVKEWDEAIEKWGEVIWAVNRWTICPSSETIEDFRSMPNEMRQVILNCKPLTRLIKHIFDEVCDAVNSFIREVERSSYEDEEEVYLYSELNRFCLQKPDMETYEFFHRLRVTE